LATTWAELCVLTQRPSWSDSQSWRECQEKRHEWNNDAKSKLRTLVGESRDRDATIEVDTCFDLYNAEDEIRQYLKAKSEIFPEKPVRFEAKVQVGAGFIAPQYLLSGLLAHFDDDWKRIIDEYGQAVDVGNSPLKNKEVLVLQAFLFRCWLLWGPSVPIGKCHHWQHGRQLLQFGYGDETNSVVLAGPDGGDTDTWSRFTATATGPRALAVQARVTGNIELTTVFDSQDVCTAQHSVVNDEQSRIVVSTTEVKSLGGSGSDVSGYYYSAYLWVIFIICKDGEPLHPDREGWRNLLTSFEHGNIAEPSPTWHSSVNSPPRRCRHSRSSWTRSRMSRCTTPVPSTTRVTDRL
jgi:hypothetical protein